MKNKNKTRDRNYNLISKLEDKKTMVEKLKVIATKNKDYEIEAIYFGYKIGIETAIALIKDE